MFTIFKYLIYKMYDFALSMDQDTILKKQPTQC